MYTQTHTHTHTHTHKHTHTNTHTHPHIPHLSVADVIARDYALGVRFRVYCIGFRL